MIGWARFKASAKFHVFAPWDANEMFLVPGCRRQLMLRRAHARLRTRAELPEDAKLCQGCTASKEARMTA